MTPAYFRAVARGADAELRGDAATAGTEHCSVPMFVESTHGKRLKQLAELGDEAPSWLVSRWVTVQARRRAWTGGDETAPQRVLKFLVPLLYPDHIPWELMGCDYVEQVMPWIFERDWVVRQFDLYELGALRDLVRDHATPQLLDRADDLDAWRRAPMRALRLESSGDGRSDHVVVTDLRTSDLVEVLDLGLGEQHRPGQHLLGRLVPTACEPGTMFDWAPLPVPEGAARAVARTPSQWLAALNRQLVAGRLQPGFAHQPEMSLTADLPRQAWMGLLGSPLADAPDRDPDQAVVDGLRVALGLAEAGAHEARRHRALIGELLLDPAVTDAVRSRYATQQHRQAWQVLADELLEPARRRAAVMRSWCDYNAPDATG